MQKQTLKEHIVSVAGKLFYKNGYNATGVNEIIAKAEIAKATLYHHFRSKEAICIAYLEGRHTIFMEALKQTISKKADGKAKLLGIFDLLREIYRSDDFYGCWAIKIVGELPPDHLEVRSVILKQKKELLLYLGEIVGDTIANISKAETEKISSGLYLLYESAIMESYIHENDWPIHMAKSIAPSFFSESLLR